MRIDLNQAPQATSETRSSSDSAALQARTSSAPAPGEDQARLSGSYVQVTALAAQASQLPEVREDRVAALREAIFGGNYDVGPEQVAGAIFSQMIAQTA